jgi:dephospho-CoA kinase
MLRVAITGGIACGKSLVASMLAEEGVPVCDSDCLAHDLLAAGTDVSDELVAFFGDGILGTGGVIDRQALGSLVFARPDQLGVLNSIVHPRVKQQWNAWLDERADACVAAVTIPLLYEIGESVNWDRVICVATPPADQRIRMRERGLDDAAIDARLAAQMPTHGKMVKADHVIFNCSTEEVLREQVARTLRKILEK